MALILDQPFTSDPGAGFATLRSSSGTFTATYNAGQTAYDLSNSGTTSSNLWDLTSLSYYAKGEFEIDVESVANFATPATWDAGIHLLNGVSGNISNGYSMQSYQNSLYIQQYTGVTAWGGVSSILITNNVYGADSLFGAASRLKFRVKWDSTAPAGSPTMEYFVNDKKLFTQLSAIVSLRPAVFVYAGTFRVHGIKVWDDLVTPMSAIGVVQSSELGQKKSTSITNNSYNFSTGLSPRRFNGISYNTIALINELSPLRTNVLGPTKISNNKASIAKANPSSNGNGTIYGTVKIKGAPNYPVSRKVQIIEEGEERLVSEMWSSATDGSYNFGNLDQSKSYTLITYDHTGVYNAAVASGMYARNTSSVVGNNVFPFIGTVGWTLIPTGDSYYTSVELLMHANGTNNSTSITDSGFSTKTLTAFGGAVVSTTESKFGGSSLRIANNPDYVSVSPVIDLSSGSYTVEGFVNSAGISVGDYFTILTVNDNTGTDRWRLDFGVATSSTGLMRALSVGNTVNLTSPTFAYTTGTWGHFAFVNDVVGNTFKEYFEGQEVASRAAFSLANYSTMQIGRQVGAWSPVTNYIDELRITKGVARYNANFTPPAAPFIEIGSDYAYVNLLLHMNGANNSTTFTDNSGVPKTVTANSGAKITTAQSKFGGSSLELTGTNYLAAGAIADWRFLQKQNESYTVEAFVRSTNFSAYQFIAINNDSNGPSTTFYCIAIDVTTGYPYVQIGETSNTYNVNTYSASSIALSLNTWSHVAHVYNHSTRTHYLWVDGALSASVVKNASFPTNQNTNMVLNIGAYNNGSLGFKGNIDEFRVTKGTARYLTSFTPPTAPFSDS